MNEHYDSAKSDAEYANTMMANTDSSAIEVMSVMLLGSIAQRLGAIADTLEWQVKEEWSGDE